jgi:hypothetical protein
VIRPAGKPPSCRWEKQAVDAALRPAIPVLAVVRGLDGQAFGHDIRCQALFAGISGIAQQHDFAELGSSGQRTLEHRGVSRRVDNQGRTFAFVHFLYGREVLSNITAQRPQSPAPQRMFQTECTGQPPRWTPPGSLAQRMAIARPPAPMIST